MSDEKDKMGLRMPLSGLFDSTNPDDKESHDTKIPTVKVSQLQPYKNYVFHKNKNTMDDLVESIEDVGILQPLIVRDIGNDKFEILSGHCRYEAAKKAHFSEVPAIKKEMDDEKAEQYVADSNIQRTELLPSERAWMYRIKLDARKRHVGRPSKDDTEKENTGKELEQTDEGEGNKTRGRTDDALAHDENVSRSMFDRYVQLTNLEPELLNLVDDGELSIGAGVSISHLDNDEQETVLNAYKDGLGLPTEKQADEIRDMKDNGGITQAKVNQKLTKPEKTPKPKKPKPIKLDREEIESYLGNRDDNEIIKIIFEALELWLAEN